jgi:hypothetical protein
MGLTIIAQTNDPLGQGVIRDVCPVFPGERYLDWELTDPSGKSLDEVRGNRDRSTGGCATCSPGW